jgi:hypothetical protein
MSRPVLSPIVRLMNRTKISESGCWDWYGTKTRDGSGVVTIRLNGKNAILAHRLSWMIHFGEISDCQVVYQKCQNRGCVNPNHLSVRRKNENRVGPRLNRKWKCSSCKINPDYYDNCKQCKRLSMRNFLERRGKEWLKKKSSRQYLKHKEKRLESAKLYKQANKDKALKNWYDWVKNNPDKANALHRRYRENNREKCRLSNRKYKYKKIYRLEDLIKTAELLYRAKKEMERRAR